MRLSRRGVGNGAHLTPGLAGRFHWRLPGTGGGQASADRRDAARQAVPQRPGRGRRQRRAGQPAPPSALTCSALAPPPNSLAKAQGASAQAGRTGHGKAGHHRRAAPGRVGQGGHHQRRLQQAAGPGHPQQPGRRGPGRPVHALPAAGAGLLRCQAAGAATQVLQPSRLAALPQQPQAQARARRNAAASTAAAAPARVAPAAPARPRWTPPPRRPRHSRPCGRGGRPAATHAACAGCNRAAATRWPGRTSRRSAALRRHRASGR